MMKETHQPVLLEEILEGLMVRSDGKYIDATFGRGGHSLAILDQLGPEGRLLALDKDPEAVRHGQQGVFLDPRFAIRHMAFSHIREAALENGWLGEVSGIVFDLGVSSPQLDEPERGFSFRHDGPLDMRMNPEQGMDAATWINRAKQSEIADVLWRYGEERFARRIAAAIVARRASQPIVRTQQLADLIARTVTHSEPDKHPATRSFQAIRIFINHELEELQSALDQVHEVLTIGGRLCVISFHSLEDRIVKRFIQHSGADELPREIPIPASDLAQPHFRKIGGLIHPDEKEIKRNVRARSARLRIAEKIS